ncbi:DMT family transporter [Luteithermobacter gelatinilyticus]|uniref:DMT family transporter n=1 Tax=Luteithermobacter gelatinilyticus TaxID=2582913 RepID=UPI001106CCBC|nr:DMT family transporter [Luteithermobacter gelatinilyticus]
MNGIQDQTARHNLTGILFMILAGVNMAAGTIFIRKTGQSLGIFEVVFLRSAVIVLLAVLLSRQFSPALLKPARPGLIATRSLLMCVIVMANFTAIMYLPLVQVTAMQFTRPLFLVVLAALFLGEAVRLPRTLATFAGFLGILIILRPGSGTHPAMMFLLAATIASSVNAIITKKLTKTDRVGTMMIYGNMALVIVCLPFALLNWITPTGENLLWLLGLAATSGFTQYCIIRAYHYGEATLVAPFDYLRIVFVALVGYVAFGEVPDSYTWAGTAVIILSTLFIAWRQSRLSRTQLPPRTPPDPLQ